MSLDWNVRKVANYEEVCWIGDDLNPVTHQLVFATVGVGIPAITEKNAGEFYARLTIMQMLTPPGKGWILQREGEDAEWVSRFITPDEVRAHIGLSTNASPLTRAKFLSGQVGRDMDDMVRLFDSTGSTSVQKGGDE